MADGRVSVGFGEIARIILYIRYSPNGEVASEASAAFLTLRICDAALNSLVGVQTVTSEAVAALYFATL